MANWLLFLGGLVAVFRGQLAKISRCSRARVSNGQGGITMGTLAIETLSKWVKSLFGNLFL
jgi:hypothetical protein